MAEKPQRLRTFIEKAVARFLGDRFRTAGVALHLNVVQHTVNAGEDPHTKAFGVHFNAASPLIWFLAGALIIGGFGVARRTWTGSGRPGTRHSLPHVKKDSTHDVACRRVTRGAEELWQYFGDPRRQSDRCEGRAPRLDRTEWRGKSTLFNLISGYIIPTVGSILLKDEIVSGLPPYQINRRGLSRSFQVSNVFANMSVWENIRCALLWATGHRYAFWKPGDHGQCRNKRHQISAQHRN
jgi:hypothetical protein